MKSPKHPTPSGDRRIAQLFFSALRKAGFRIELASDIRSWEGKGDKQNQIHIHQFATQHANRLIDEYLRLPEEKRPRGWFTYHVYHKAPDWIGPIVCEALKIPYFIAEASVAQKQANGKWQQGYEQSLRCIRLASVIFSINPNDQAGLEPIRDTQSHMVTLKPFLDIKAANTQQRVFSRQNITVPTPINRQYYWLLCVAMMRDDAKLESYKLLAKSLHLLEREDWQLLIVGDGPAEIEVRKLFAPFGNKILYLGQQTSTRIYELMRASDLLVWPAVNEAIGLVSLEALACGLPVIAGNSGGIAEIVKNGQTGILTGKHGECESSFVLQFAQAIEQVLNQPSRLADLSNRSLQQYDSEHTLSVAAKCLSENIVPLLPSSDSVQR